MRLKRWESPRREGRNDKGKKKPVRERQIKAATQALRRKLKGDGRRDSQESLFLWLYLGWNAIGVPKSLKKGGHENNLLYHSLWPTNCPKTFLRQFRCLHPAYRKTAQPS